MKKPFVLGVIGAGFMSTAIISGILSAKVLKKSQIIVSDLNDDALIKMQKLGVKTTKDNSLLAKSSEFVLFAIKPQNFNDVAISIKDENVEKIISIMAGVKKDKIRSYFKDSKIVRCMPNTPCSIGEGAVGIDNFDLTDKKDIEFIDKIFSSFASVSYLTEDKINAVTGISGSSPAYFYLFIKAIVESGIKNGLSYETALNLATSTMIGAGKMIIKNNDKSLDELINAVCSKGGTTIEAIKTFNENNLMEICDKAVNACIKRSKELEDNL